MAGTLTPAPATHQRRAIEPDGTVHAARYAGSRTTHTNDGEDQPQQVVFAPQINTGGTRLLGRSGDVNIQLGDRNRNKQ